MSIYESSIYQNDLKNTFEMILNREKLNDKSILITGATGLIGSYMVDVLMYMNQIHNSNINIYAVSRSADKLKKRFNVQEDVHLHFIEHDICEEINEDINIDYIIHAASPAYPALFAEKPVETIMSNIAGCYNLLEFGKKNNIDRFMFVSSGEVYGQSDGQVKEYSEKFSGYVDSMSVRSCYPNSKRTAETICVAYAKQYDMDVVVVRPCHTYGPTVTEHDNRANAQFINNVLANEDIILKSKGLQLRSYCYVADCVSAILSVLTKGNKNEAYNIANRNAKITVAGFAETVAKLEGKKIVYSIPNDKEKAQMSPIDNQVLDVTKLEELGWKGKYAVEEGIKNVLDILKEK